MAQHPGNHKPFGYNSKPPSADTPATDMSGPPPLAGHKDPPAPSATVKNPRQTGSTRMTHKHPYFGGR